MGNVILTFVASDGRKLLAILNASLVIVVRRQGHY